MPSSYYSNVKHLDKLKVYKNDYPDTFGVCNYFKISKFPEFLTYGKHTFLLAIQVPDTNRLVPNSSIDFEIKDPDGTVVYSDTTLVESVNGAAVLYVDVRQDPLRTNKDIISGYGTFTIVGEMSGVPVEWQGKPNYRVQWPVEFRPNAPNTSPLVFMNAPQLTASVGPFLPYPTDYHIQNINQTWIKTNINQLETYGGQVRYVEISSKPGGESALSSSAEYIPTVTLDLLATSTGQIILL